MRRIGKIVLLIPVAMIVVIMGALSTLVLYFSNLPSEVLRSVLAAAYAVAYVAAFVFWTRRRTMLAMAAGSWLLTWLWWYWIPASNDRDWHPTVAVLPTADIDGDRVTVRNIRNFEYTSETEFTPRYYDKVLDLKQLEGTDFFWSYWDGIESIAHTFFSFRFTDGFCLCCSVEIRPEKGETYSPIAGSFKQYEIIYVIGDERDLVRVRTNYRGERTYLYPSMLTRSQSRMLLLSVLQRINSLAETPVHYRTLGRNCTTAIVDHLGEVTGRSLKFHRKLLMNGYSDELAYQHGVLPTDMPFTELKRRHLISGIAKRYNESPDFSRKIRSHLPTHPR